jgi:hypothetical protein
MSGQVRLDRDEIAVYIDGKPFTTFYYSTVAANTPYLSPLRSASGKIVTRLFPMEMVEGEPRDHMHHRGLWFSYLGVNGFNFWENDPSYAAVPALRGSFGRIVVRHAEFKPGEKSGTLTATADWIAPNGKVQLVEDRVMTFYSDPKLRTIDFLFTFTAVPDVTFGDDKDGVMAVRLAKPLTEMNGGTMVDADGRSTMMNVWGKRSNWIDCTGVVEGERVGIAIFDNPKNLNYPTYWHARDYGLIAANPLSPNAFDPSQPEGNFKLAAGKKLVFRYRVIIHPGDTEAAHVADMYKEYLAAKP